MPLLSPKFHLNMVVACEPHVGLPIKGEGEALIMSGYRNRDEASSKVTSIKADHGVRKGVKR